MTDTHDGLGNRGRRFREDEEDQYERVDTSGLFYDHKSQIETTLEALSSSDEEPELPPVPTQIRRVRRTKCTLYDDEPNRENFDHVPPQSTRSSVAARVETTHRAHTSEAQLASAEVPSSCPDPSSDKSGKMAVSHGELASILVGWVVNRPEKALNEVLYRDWADDAEPDTVEEAVLQTLADLAEPLMVSDVYNAISNIRPRVYRTAIRQGLDDVGIEATEFLVLSHLWHHFHSEKKVADFPWMKHKPDRMAGGSDDRFHGYRRYLERTKAATKPMAPQIAPSAPVSTKAAPPPAKLGDIPPNEHNQKQPVALPAALQAPTKVTRGPKYPPPNRSNHEFSKMIRLSKNLRGQAWRQYKGGPEYDPSGLPFEVCFKDRAFARKFFCDRRVIDHVNAKIGGRVKFLYHFRENFVCLVLSPNPNGKLRDIYPRLIVAWELAMELKRKLEHVGAAGSQTRHPDLAEYFRNNWDKKWGAINTVHNAIKQPGMLMDEDN